jgi:hypothetical protein
MRAWMRAIRSLIVRLTLMQCPHVKCWFIHGDKCMSSCPEALCGRSCMSQPIFDRTDLDYYAANNCTLLLSGLTISNLPLWIDTEALAVLQTVRKIAGPLRIVNNNYLVSLSFLSGLEVVDSIIITGNAALVDARLPRLNAQLSQTRSLSVRGNPFLCPERVVTDHTSPNSNCRSSDLSFYVSCRGVEAGTCTATLAQATGHPPQRVS